MADPIVRRDIWSLEGEQAWHPITVAYARAVNEMQQRDPDDPTSWSYQAAIHGNDQRDDFRDQCQHNSWFFLPWHRMYLHWFERMIRAALQGLTDVPAEVKSSWALPYWNYDRGAETPTLPAPFREERTPDGNENPLFVEERHPYINQGAALPTGPDGVTSPAGALREPSFTERPVSGRTAAFGGPVTGWHHFDENEAIPGELEQTPHNLVHSLVGGRGGLMNGLNTAPLDPIFWLHHANIDRLWEVWLAQEGRTNPADREWTGLSFDFHDESGRPVKLTPAEVTETEGLGYTYDQVAVPEVVGVGPERMDVVPSEPPDHPAELVGATDQGLELAGQTTDVEIPVSQPSGPLAALEKAELPTRAYLNLEGVEGEEDPGLAYAVYLNLPDDQDPDSAPESYHVGNVSFFGIERARQVDRDHAGGHGLRYAFDITDLVAELRDAGRWDPDKVRVTFTPVRLAPPEGETELEAAEETPPVQIGRVGLYYQ
jgi:tyrosinase